MAGLQDFEAVPAEVTVDAQLFQDDVAIAGDLGALVTGRAVDQVEVERALDGDPAESGH